MSTLTFATFQIVEAQVVFPSDAESVTAGGLPDPPTDLTVEINDGYIILGWIAPVILESDTFTVITNYEIVYRILNDPDWIPYEGRVYGVETSERIDSFDFGTSYDIKVRSVHNNGSPDVDYFGEYTEYVVVIPTASPTKTSISSMWDISELGHFEFGDIIITWDEPESNGSPIISYILSYTEQGGTTPATVEISTSPYTLSEQTVGKVFDFSIEVNNDIGSSMSDIDTLFSQPSIIKQQQVTAAMGGYDVTWDVPDFDGGREIIGYAIYTQSDVTDKIILHNSELIVETNYEIRGLPSESHKTMIVPVNEINQSFYDSELTDHPEN